MPERTKLTNSSDESKINDVISGEKAFSIPLFQRSYKWKPKQLDQLNKDILSVIDDEDFHFLGAVIVHGRRSNPSDPKIFDIIDGQQRITTIFIYICAIVKQLTILGDYDVARDLFFAYLVINRETNLQSNIKLHVCKDDRKQLRQIFEDLLSDANFKLKLQSFVAKFLPDSGTEDGRVWKNYKLLLRFLTEQVADGGRERLDKIYKAILESISVVQIDVWDPSNGPKIFDSLNSQQEPMTIGELVRNEVFSRVAARPIPEIERIESEYWQPFYNKFKQNGENAFDSYFYPYALIHEPNVKKSEAYNNLRNSWRAVEAPGDIITALAKYQNAFIDLVYGTNHQGSVGRVAELFNNIYRYNAPSSTYPFFMQLSNASKEGTIDVAEIVGVMEMIESFLVRRAVCGHEPTGLHAIFRKLWSDCSNRPTPSEVKRVIKNHSTVVWPDDNEFTEKIKKRPLYGTGIVKYIVAEFNKSLGGDQPGEIPWLEHVLPESPNAEWFDIFTHPKHEAMKHLLANLIPLSAEMNRELGNKLYTVKKEKYLADSMFKTARDFATKYDTWTPETLKRRAEDLAVWAVARWKY